MLNQKKISITGHIKQEMPHDKKFINENAVTYKQHMHPPIILSIEMHSPYLRTAVVSSDGYVYVLVTDK